MRFSDPTIYYPRSSGQKSDRPRRDTISVPARTRAQMERDAQFYGCAPRPIAKKERKWRPETIGF